jgi:hypothetical protein
MEKLVVSLKCPHCKKSLMNENIEINEFESIKVKISYRESEGELYLSAVYGSYDIISRIDVPEGECAVIACTECKTSLLIDERCEECGALLAIFELNTGGRVQICSRRGCRYHSIDFSDPTQKISALYTAYEVFADPQRKNKK